MNDMCKYKRQKIEILAEKLFGTYSRPHVWFVYSLKDLDFFRCNIIEMKKRGFGSIVFFGNLYKNPELKNDEFYHYRDPQYVKVIMTLAKNVGFNIIGYIHSPRMGAMLKRTNRTIADLFSWIEKTDWNGVYLDNAAISNNHEEINQYVYMLKQILKGPIIHHQSVKPLYEKVDENVWYDFSWNKYVDYIRMGETNFVKPPAWWWKYCMSTIYNPYCNGLGLYGSPSAWYCERHNDPARYMYNAKPFWLPLLPGMMLAALGSSKFNILDEYYFPRFNELKNLYLTDPNEFFRIMPLFPEKMIWE